MARITSAPLTRADADFIKKQVADDIADRRAREPLRYYRPVDAAHLGDLITVICNPENWRHYFGVALSEAFQAGNEEARIFLGRLVDVRHRLSHANPISVHEAARVICYTLDVTQALKGYYMQRNLEKEYNVPTIIRVTDFFGNLFDVSGKRGYPEPSVIQFNATLLGSLRPGDRLSIEAEIDPSFERSSYRTRWKWPGTLKSAHGEQVTIDIEYRHVHQIFPVACFVISNEEWHKFGDYDDRVSINYRVLPPLS